jgi:hypothetical protein
MDASRARRVAEVALETATASLRRAGAGRLLGRVGASAQG